MGLPVRRSPRGVFPDSRSYSRTASSSYGGGGGEEGGFRATSFSEAPAASSSYGGGGGWKRGAGTDPLGHSSEASAARSSYGGAEGGWEGSEPPGRSTKAPAGRQASPAGCQVSPPGRVCMSHTWYSPVISSSVSSSSVASRLRMARWHMRCVRACSRGLVDQARGDISVAAACRHHLKGGEGGRRCLSWAGAVVPQLEPLLTLGLRRERAFLVDLLLLITYYKGAPSHQPNVVF